MKKALSFSLIIALVLTVVDAPLLAAKPNNKQAKTGKSQEKTAKNSTKNKQSKKEAKTEAQKLKAEIQEWKKRKNDMQPLQLKDLIEENHRLKTQKRNLDVYLLDLELRLAAEQEKLAALSNIQAEKEKVDKSPENGMPRDFEELPAGSYRVDQATGQVFIDGMLDTRYGADKSTGKPFIKGIIFKVQVSATKDIDLTDVLVDDTHHTNLEQEKVDDLNKYTIGHFYNYWEADKLKKGLRQMGIKWAWIVPYKDGKRVLLKEVLTTVIGGKQTK